MFGQLQTPAYACFINVFDMGLAGACPGKQAQQNGFVRNSMYAALLGVVFVVDSAC